MPQGVSVVSMVAKCKGSLIALDKQHLSFTMLCRRIDVILPNNIRISDGLSQAWMEAYTVGATQSNLQTF